MNDCFLVFIFVELSLRVGILGQKYGILGQFLDPVKTAFFSYGYTGRWCIEWSEERIRLRAKFDSNEIKSKI